MTTKYWKLSDSSVSLPLSQMTTTVTAHPHKDPDVTTLILWVHWTDSSGERVKTNLDGDVFVGLDRCGGIEVAGEGLRAKHEELLRRLVAAT